MSELHWLRGELWPWLLCAPLVWWLLLLAMRSLRRGATRYGAELTDQTRSPGVRATLWTLALCCLHATVLEPQLGVEQLAVERRGLDLVFCLDTSRSMLARDVEPDRLTRARLDIESVLPALVGGDRAGLIAFAGDGKVVAPLTHDLDSFRELLRRTDTDTVRRGGSDIAAAIRKGLELVGDQDTATTVFLLLTDGEDLAGAGRQAAQEAAARGIVVHAIGYGSTAGSRITVQEADGERFLQSGGDEVLSRLDADGLRALAEATGGEFVRADVLALPLLELKHKRLDPMHKRSYDAGLETQRKSRFQWPLLLAFGLLLAELWTLGGRRT
jgi:Ca-activated chloride channel family protein